MSLRNVVPWISMACGTLLVAAGIVSATLEDTTTAQASTSLAAYAELERVGYPELRLVATDGGFSAPSKVAAGRYLVVLENDLTPSEEGAVTDVNILQLPAGVSIDELNGLIETAGAPPAWFDDIVSLGGFNVDAGETGYGVIDLPTGEWSIGIGDTNPYVPLTVTGNINVTPAAVATPEADITLHLSDFAFDIPGQILAGTQVWHTENVGSQQHELVLYKTEELLTADQVIAALTLPEGETPPPGVPDPSSIERLSAGLKTMSPGREIWTELDLEPGFYVALCINLDAETGAPHAMHGMIDIFTVGSDE
jgi:hypothetical protein